MADVSAIPDSSTPPTDVLVGTAGHVDHGKTRLVARLTGIDTDRLPEEKTRGISIDLGFAHWTAGGFRFGVVDVPGHERFVRTMVAGATGIDVALLVVAADDGVMPQTREHLDVLNLLGLERGVIALTKVDLVDEETVELLRMEVDELVAGTFLEAAEVVAVSCETGVGLEEAEAAIVRAARERRSRVDHGTFRLSVDRVFTLPGHGTIVTGSTRHGHVRAGDVLEIPTTGQEVRVRSVETHGDDPGDVASRRRTAINLAGVSVNAIERGAELATPGILVPTRRLVVRLHALPSAPGPLRSRDDVRLHLGTADVPARVVLAEDVLPPGGEGFAELRVQEPVVASSGQRFILRRPSPPLTIAGGGVLDPHVPDRHRLRGLGEYAARLADGSSEDRLATMAERWDAIPAPPALALRLGTTIDAAERLIAEQCSSGAIVELAGERLVHRRRLDAVRSALIRTVREELALRHPRRTLPREAIRGLCERLAPEPLVEHALQAVTSTGEFVTVGDHLGPADLAVNLTKRQRAARSAALAAIDEAGMTPPTLRELAEVTDTAPAALAELLDGCTDEGLLIRVSDQLWFPVDVLECYRTACVGMLGEVGEVSLSQLRERWGVTRKWAVPVAEHLDATGVTVRVGDVRRLGPRPS